MDSSTGFCIVDKDGDPLSARHLKVYLDRNQADYVMRGADGDNPKLAPHTLVEVLVVVQP